MLTEAHGLTRDEFIGLYGTEFLAGVQLGGYYYGVIEIESTSTQEQNSIAIAVSASGWGARADG